jgi:uncharacterized protein involved in exopolysaccharide biosynthesis
MTETKSNSSDELIKAGQLFFKYLLKRWWLFILFVATGVALGTAYYYRQKPKYQAVCTFILEEKSAGGGGLSGLASQFGFNIGSLSGGSIFTGDNILNILKSKKVVEQVLLSKANDSSANGETLADLYLNFTGLKNSWRNKPALSGISFSNLGQLTTVQDSVLNAIHEGIVKNDLSAEKASKQGTIIRVQVTAANSQFARLMTERLVDAASKLYLDIRVGTAERNIQQLQRRSDSLLLLLNNKSYKAAASQPLDINPGIKTASVPVEIAMRDKTVLSTLYAEVTKNLEASKMLLSQQTPVIELLDRPEYLLKDLKKSLSFSIVVFFALMVCVYLGLSFILFFLKNNLSKP